MSAGKPLIRLLGPGDEAPLEAYLLSHIESSVFLLSNLREAGLGGRDNRYQGTYAAAFMHDAIVGVVGHYWNGNLLVQAPLPLLPALLPIAVSASGQPIKGFLGPRDQVGIAMDTLNVLDAQLQLDDREVLYALSLGDLSVPDVLLSGQVRARRIQPGDLDFVTAWRVSYRVESTNVVEDPKLWESCRESMLRYLAQRRTWILEAAGQPVAMSSFNAVLAELVQVGGVWTPPALRSRGYARAAVAASLLDARADGVPRAILFTGEGNIAARRAYEALGFRRIGDYRITLLR